MMGVITQTRLQGKRRVGQAKKKTDWRAYGRRNLINMLHSALVLPAFFFGLYETKR